MIRGHKIKLNPTPSQETYFRKAVGTARFVYNWALEHWKKYKEECPGEDKGPMALKREFNAIKRQQFPWVLDVTKCASDRSFFNLRDALNRYFNGNGNVGFPKFKSKKRRRQSFYIQNDHLRLNGHEVRIPKLGWVNMTEELRFDGKIINATVSTDGEYWYIAINVEVSPPKEHEFESPSVGIDCGVKQSATLSDGTIFENQEFHKSELRKLARLNRELSRRQQGSNRWYRTKKKLQRLHRNIRNRRLDTIHKMTTHIAKTYELIGVEDLNVKGMMQNRRLSRAIADVGMGETRRQLEYKSKWYGGQTIRVDRFFASSKLCSECTHKNTELQLSDRQWVCQKCGTLHDRDDNASKNIEAEMLRIAAVATSR